VVTEPQATLLISTGAGHTLDGQLTIQGSGQWTGGGIGLGGTLLVEPAGVFEIAIDQTISTRSGPAQVVNQGTLRKTTTTGVANFSGTTAFVHTGTVDVQTGTLYLDGAVTSSGPMQIAAGAFIDVAGTMTMTAGANVTGEGALRVGGSATGEVVASVAVVVDRLVLRTFGSISGPQPVTVLEHFDWQAGSINTNATVVTESQATLLISTGAGHTLDGQLTIQGSGQWTGGGIGLGGTLLVEPGGVFEIAVDQTISTRSGPAQVVNQGTLRKTTTTGVANFSGTTAFVHSGTVDVQTGALYLDGTSTLTGDVLIAAGAFVDVAGTFRLQEGSRVLGDGMLRVGGSANGELHLEANADIDGLSLRTFGTVLGPLTATIRRHFHWESGVIDHGAELVVDSAATFAISTSSGRTLDGALILDGDGLWTGGGIALGGLLSLGPTAALEIEVDQTISARTSQALVINAGQIRKRITGGATTFGTGVGVINSGEWRVESGTFHFADGFEQNGGALRLEGGGVTSNGVLQIEGGTLRGAGTIDAHVQSASVIEPGDGVGQLLIDGNLMLSAASVVRFQIGGLIAATQHDRLIVNGAATLHGVAQVAIVDDFAPEFGDAFVPFTATVRNGLFASFQGLGIGDGKALVPSYADGNFVLTTAPSVGSPAELIRDQLNEGLAHLRETLEDWVGLFDIEDFELPVVPDELAVIFELPALVEEFVTSWLPSANEVVDTLNDLRDALTALGFQVICVEGEPACAPDDMIRVQFTQNVPLETSIGPFNDQTPGLLTDLAGSPQLNGDLTLDGDLNVALTFGVDSSGFFLLGDSNVRLNDLTAVGSIQGAGAVGGEAGVDLTGSANASVSLDVLLQMSSPSVKHRLGQLSGDPSTFLVATASGDASLALDFTVGPAALTWESHWLVESEGPTVEVNTTSVIITGDVTFPGLTEDTGGGPVEASLSAVGVYDGVWRITVATQGGASYAFGGFALEDWLLELTIGDDVFSGQFTGGLTAYFGSEATAIQFEIDSTFDAQSFDATIVGTFAGGPSPGGYYVGTNPAVLWVDDVVATLEIAVPFATPTNADISVELTAAAVVVLPEVAPPSEIPDGVVRLFDIAGSIDGNQIIRFAAGSIEADFGALRITAAGDPAVSITYDPHDASPTAVIATVAQAVASLPLYPTFPTATLTELVIRRNGLSLDSLLFGGDQGFDVTLGAIVAMQETRVELQDLQIIAGSAAPVTGAIQVTATSATLFPGGADLGSGDRRRSRG
jgi:hypothetical protein